MFDLPIYNYNLTILLLFQCLFFILLFLISLKINIINIPKNVIHKFEKVAQKRFLVLLLVGVVAFLASASISLLVNFPEPAIHDEFSYLLAADTFASGRLANPPHPFWRHFESFHILQQPTYSSKYPPGRGLALALGQVLGGHPIIGVWLSLAIVCVSICWMLQGWISARWAFVGGLLAALQFSFFGNWGQSYWGGAVAATGGALVFGALRRILKQPSWGHSFLMGTGLVLLAISRPMEGMLASLPVGVILFKKLLYDKVWPVKVSLKRIVFPVGMVLLMGFLWIGYYNYKVTGNPFLFPYILYNNTYPKARHFLWEKPQPKIGKFPQVFQQFYLINLQKSELKRSLNGFFIFKSIETIIILTFYSSFTFILLLGTLPSLLKNRWNLLAFSITSLTYLVVLIEKQTLPRKMAPVACLMVLLVIQAIRNMRIWRRLQIPSGKSMAQIMLITYAVSILVSFSPPFHKTPWPPIQQRASLMRKLNQDSERHLIVVRYSPNHWVYFDWVYNQADIEGAKVVWARELDEASNHKLVEHFKDRKIWLLEADIWMEGRHVALVPYFSGKYSAN